MLRQLLEAWTQEEPLKQVSSKFQEMLILGRRMLDLVTEALFAGEDLSGIRDEIRAMDGRINGLEQEIRKLIFTKLTVERDRHVATCLILFAVVRDAERCGDYAKNIYEVFLQSKGLVKDEYYSALQEMRARLSFFFSEAAEVFQTSDTARASQLLKKAREVGKSCDAYVTRILVGTDCSRPAAYALLFRFFKRIVRHLMNIVTSVVMPIDKLDYFDEDYRLEVEKKVSRGEIPHAHGGRG